MRQWLCQFSSGLFDAFVAFSRIVSELGRLSRRRLFDLQNACFTPLRPQLHSDYIAPEEAARLTRLMRMNYETMHLFAMSRMERARCLTIMNEYYRLHLPDFPVLKSLEVLKELFD